MKYHGFSLLELLITLAIVALLTALAWPGYASVMHRAQRSDARLALLAIQHAEEQHYQSFNEYSDTLDGSGAETGLGLTERSATDSYALTVSTSGNAQHYSAAARVVSGGRQAADDACMLFTIDEAGQRAALDANGGDNTILCWR